MVGAASALATIVAPRRVTAVIAWGTQGPSRVKARLGAPRDRHQSVSRERSRGPGQPITVGAKAHSTAAPVHT